MKAAEKWVILNAREEAGRIILEPHSNFDRERVERRMKNGRGQVRASLASIRSLPQLRLYWPWVRKVLENSEHFTTERNLHNMLLQSCGVVETFIDLNGDWKLIPSSIAFDAMDQEDFDAYFNKAQIVVSEHILPGVDLEALMRETKKECGWSSPPNTEKQPPSSADGQTLTRSRSSSDRSGTISSRSSTPTSSFSPHAMRETPRPAASW